MLTSKNLTNRKNAKRYTRKLPTRNTQRPPEVVEDSQNRSSCTRQDDSWWGYNTYKNRSKDARFPHRAYRRRKEARRCLYSLRTERIWIRTKGNLWRIWKSVYERWLDKYSPLCYRKTLWCPYSPWNSPLSPCSWYRWHGCFLFLLLVFLWLPKILQKIRWKPHPVYVLVSTFVLAHLISPEMAMDWIARKESSNLS